MGNRTDDFLRAVSDALRADVPTAEILDSIALLPLDQRAAVLSKVVAANDKAGWPADVVADAFLQAGAKEHALSTLASALSQEPHAAWIQQMVAADPAKAAALLKDIAKDHEWPADRLVQAGFALAAAGRADLSAAFYKGALDRSPFDREAIASL